MPKKTTTDAIKTVSKKEIQKTAEATGDLIGNKIVDEITSDSKTSSEELQIKNDLDKANNEISKERCISPEERQQITDELRLV